MNNEIFRKCLKKYNITQAQVARDTGIHRTQLQCYNVDRYEMGNACAMVLAHYFGLQDLPRLQKKS